MQIACRHQTELRGSEHMSALPVMAVETPAESQSTNVSFSAAYNHQHATGKHLSPENSGEDSRDDIAIDSDGHDKAEKEDLDFDDLPPFPDDIPTAPLLRISLFKLLQGEQAEVDRLWTACCDLGFFYLDLRGARSSLFGQAWSPVEQHDLTANPWGSEAEDDGGNGIEGNGGGKAKTADVETNVDGDQLLKDAYSLFDVGSELFELPLAEKLRYDFSERGSYFGYKGYGHNIIDDKGTTDRNEFYNVSKDDVLGFSDPLPSPSLLVEHRPLLSSYMRHSHAVVSMILRLLNARLDLPPEMLPSLHRLDVLSGDQVRWVKSPPQPPDDHKTSMGAHADYGSVTILFNRLGGLQVLPPGPPDGDDNNDNTNDNNNDAAKWCFVRPLKGHAIVNIGDAMVKFSAGILRSNLHRVVNPPGEQAGSTRMSLVYFSRPCDHVVLKPLSGSKMIDDRRGKKKSKRNEHRGNKHGNHDGGDDKEEEGEEEEELTSKEWILRRALSSRKGAGADWSKSRGTEGDR